MARTPSKPDTRPGRARRALGFLLRLIRATRTLGREIRRCNALRLEYNAAVKRQACGLEDLTPAGLKAVRDRNEWTLDQLIDLAGRLGCVLTPSQIMRAVVDAVADTAGIGELDLKDCHSEAELKARLMTCLMIHNLREREHKQHKGATDETVS